MPPTNVIFSTRYNFLKIYLNNSVQVSVSATVPNDYLLVTHGLGYVPRARVWYEPIAGQVWPMSNEQYTAFGGGSGTILPVTGNFYLTTSGLYVRIAVATAANVKFYYRIYVDP